MSFARLARVFGLLSASSFSPPSSPDRIALVQQARRLVKMGAWGEPLSNIIKALGRDPIDAPEVSFLSENRHAGGALSRAYAFRAAVPLSESGLCRDDFAQVCTDLLDGYRHGNAFALDRLAMHCVLPPGKEDHAFTKALSSVLAARPDGGAIIPDLNGRIRAQSEALHALAVSSGAIGSFAHAMKPWQNSAFTLPESGPVPA
ncbi:MAG: hypothetical protein H6862_01705 [Rhodospirillales bacterium]|nr:hypothetical protein [Rhodospirillales bacterium]